MKARVSIENVAQQFADLGFDDTKGKQHCRKILYELVQTDQTLPRDNNGELPKKAMIDDMKKLVAVIDSHLAKEFMALPETFDHKYNHRHVLYWIVVRDYDGIRTANGFPTWYPGLAKLMDWETDCKTITQRMIEYLSKE